ncbi:hypothetical protein Syun_029710 [Stephania yunnanensis]|uniref:Carbohydrate kinase PfkB domain-containing protein n=1 Tax=Stephania yunnanensis TaxID=152371 RepID=A0AAP0HK42_9MAGN
MHLQTLKFHNFCNTSTPHSSASSAINDFFSPNSPRNGAHSHSNQKRIEVSAPKNRSISLSLSNGFGEEERVRSPVVKDADIATLGNLCVDVVLSVQRLPLPSLEERRAYMEELSASRPDEKYWEAGGNCNVAIAAARLGLCCLTVGHVGDEIYGHFLLDVLNDEGIGMVGMSGQTDSSIDISAYETLICWVLVDPLQRHGFCSRADFSDDPAFSWLSKLSKEVKMAIRRSKVLFCNGYSFDELSPVLLASALEYSIEVGTSIFFDPGPRGKTLSSGTTEQRRALDQYLKMSDVLLLTSDEAESLTGVGNPILAGRKLLKEGVCTKWVIVKMGSKGSFLITSSSVSYAPAFKVNVVDTVGCGDSFVAAIVFGFLHNVPAINVLALANAVGAATAMGSGAGRNVASLEKVIEILKNSSLNEDSSPSVYIDENMDTSEILVLARTIVNGKNACVSHVSLQKVVSELLPKLMAVHEKALTSKCAS